MKFINYFAGNVNIGEKKKQEISPRPHDLVLRTIIFLF